MHVDAYIVADRYIRRYIYICLLTYLPRQGRQYIYIYVCMYIYIKRGRERESENRFVERGKPKAKLLAGSAGFWSTLYNIVVTREDSAWIQRLALAAPDRYSLAFYRWAPSAPPAVVHTAGFSMYLLFFFALVVCARRVMTSHESPGRNVAPNCRWTDRIASG